MQVKGVEELTSNLCFHSNLDPKSSISFFCQNNTSCLAEAGVIVVYGERILWEELQFVIAAAVQGSGEGQHWKKLSDKQKTEMSAEIFKKKVKELVLKSYKGKKKRFEVWFS